MTQPCAGGYYYPITAALSAWIAGAGAPIEHSHVPRELTAAFFRAATRGTGTCAYFLFMRRDTYAPRDASQGDPG